MRWRQEYPQQWAREREALDAAGWAWREVEAPLPDGSRRTFVDISLPMGEGILEVRCDYPDSYPYFAPHVYAPLDTFARHQNPLQGTLCLLAREGEDWEPASDTLAGLLQRQFVQVQAANQPQAQLDEVAAIEDHAAEPLSMFLPTVRESVVLVPDQTPATQVSAGRLDLELLPKHEVVVEPPSLRVLVRRVCDANGAPLVEQPLSVATRASEIRGFWARLAERPPVNDRSAPLGNQFVDLARAANREFADVFRTARDGQLVLFGFVYADETSWREHHDDWTFLVLKFSVQKRPTRKVGYTAWFVRTDWVDTNATTQRAPFLAPLADERALIVGLGSLGSPVCVQLARAGVGTLQLLDSDVLQAGNSVRWAYGLEHVGYDKATALALRLAQDYPRTKVLPERLRIGVDSGDYDRLQAMVRAADIVVDASASHRVSAFLSTLCWELGRPYVWLTTTPGARHGAVGRAHRGAYSCWRCFLRAMSAGEVRTPPVADEREVQPGGCSQPTFIGAALDSDEIALLASRLTVATLSRGQPHGYPDFDWNVAIGDLADGGRSIAAQWTTYQVAPRPDCELCATS